MKDSVYTNLNTHLFELSQDLICIAGFDGYFKYTNPVWKEILGYTEKELRSKPFLDFIHPDDHNMSNEEISNLTKGKVSLNFENRYICKNGSIKHIQWTATPIVLQKVMFCIGRDITERKQVEKELKENEKLLEEVGSISKIGGWDMDLINRKSKWTNTTYDIVEIDYNDEIPGPDDHLKYYLPEYRQMIQEAMARLINEGIPFTFEAKGRTAKNNIRWFRAIGEMVEQDENGICTRIRGTLQDITEQKLTKEKLKISELKYRNQANFLDVVIEKSPFAMWVSDEKGIMIRANQALRDMLNLSDDMLIGKYNVLNDENLNTQGLMSVVESVFNDFKNVRFTMFWSGTKVDDIDISMANDVWIDVSLFPITDETENLVNVICQYVNITEQKKAEKALQNSEIKHRAYLEHAPIGIFVVDGKGRYIDVNPGACDLLGYTEDELLKLSIPDISPDKEVKENFMQLKKEGFLSNETGLKKKDGSIIYVKLDAVSLPNDQFIAFCTDFSKRKQVEEELLENQKRYVKAQEMGHVGNWEYNPITNEIWGSDEAKKIYGFGLDSDDFTTEKVESCTPERERLHQALIDLIESDKKYDLIFDIITFDKGIRKTIHSIANAERNAQGNTIKIHGVISDITEQNRVKLELISAKAKAEESDRLKSAFLANMSHEIRTPMNGILGFTSLLKNPTLSGEELQHYIQVIEKSGIRMLNTIQDIIDISRIDSKHITLKYSTVNMNKQIDELFEFFLPEAQKKNIQLSITNRLPNQQATIHSDKDKIFSICTNLIKNALKFTHSGQIEFGCLVNNIGGKYYLEYYVKDTGIGIPKKRQKAIFDRFVQAEIKDIQRYEGSGLGLAITKAYVEMLKGEIGVESEEGVGSKFYFRIPYNTNNAKIPKKHIEKSKNQETKIKELKILIADDEEFVREYLTIILKKYRKELLIAKTGIEAVEICNNNPDIDLILMDIKIPGIDGYEATRKIRKFNSNVIIFAQTAFAQIEYKEKAIDAGCNEYIAKPISKEKLIELLSNYF